MAASRNGGRRHGASRRTHRNPTRVVALVGDHPFVQRLEVALAQFVAVACRHHRGRIAVGIGNGLQFAPHVVVNREVAVSGGPFPIAELAEDHHAFLVRHLKRRRGRSPGMQLDGIQSVVLLDGKDAPPLALVHGRMARERKTAVVDVGPHEEGTSVEEETIPLLTRATTPIRHLILFADASDSEEPGDYKEYLTQARAAGITVSVIGLGSRHDCDSKLLEEIAKLGGGECWFEERAEEIPRLFLQDTFLAAKEAMCTNLTPLKVAVPLRQISDRLPAKLPAIGGYNLTYLRPEGEAAILTDDDEHAPLLATRRVGLGRTLAFTGELSGRHAPPLMTSAQGTELAAGIVRWIRGTDVFASGGFTFERRLVAGGIRVTAVADDDNPATLLSQAGIPLVVVKDRPGLGAERTVTSLTWESANTLAAFVPLASDETAFLVARPPEGSPVVLPPICLPYSAEFRRGSNPSEGKDALARLAAQTGGRALLTVDNVWEQLPVTRHYRALAPWIVFHSLSPRPGQTPCEWKNGKRPIEQSSRSLNPVYDRRRRCGNLQVTSTAESTSWRVFESKPRPIE